MDEIQIFNFESNDVRVRMIDGEPWWVANDVCAAIGIEEPRRAVARLDRDDVRQTHVIDSMGRAQRTNVVNEDGLYELILRSDKPSAKPFRRWVTAKIKELRQYGVAMVRPMTPGEMLVAQAQMLLDAERRLTAQEDAQRETGAKLTEIETTVREVVAKQDQHVDQRDMAAQAYAQLNGLPTDHGSVLALGKAAGIIGRSLGLQPGKIQHSLFGRVNTWPDHIWELAARSLESDD